VLAVLAHHLSIWVPLALCTLLALDNWRLRRKLRVDRVARAAEEALGPPRIGDILMPDPSDSRWKLEECSFSVNGQPTPRERVLTLDAIIVEMKNGDVYIGLGPATPGGRSYGKNVIAAYRRRLAARARGMA